MPKHFMNKAVGRHMSSEPDSTDPDAQAGGAGQDADLNFDEQDKGEKSAVGKPAILIHHHSGGVTVHAMHADGQHDTKDFEHGDHDGAVEAARDFLNGARSDDAGVMGGAEVEPTTKSLNVHRPA